MENFDWENPTVKPQVLTIEHMGKSWDNHGFHENTNINQLCISGSSVATSDLSGVQTILLGEARNITTHRDALDEATDIVWMHVLSTPHHMEPSAQVQ